MRAGANPRVDRPEIPAEYGTSKATEHVEWGHVEDRLTADRVYWIATVGQCGRPRVRPIDGVYVDGVIYVGGSPKTRWVRELAANPQVSVHLDGLREVVIVEGDADVLIGVEEELARRLAAASNVKYPEYGMAPGFYQANGGEQDPRRAIRPWLVESGRIQSVLDEDRERQPRPE